VFAVLPGDFGRGASVERREMAGKSLLGMLEQLASKVRSLESEKREAIAKAQEIERDTGQAVVRIEELERENKQVAVMMQALEHEKNQATIMVQGLEREVAELGAVIIQATKKVDEMLKEGSPADLSQPRAVIPPAISTGREQLEKGSTDPRREARQSHGKAFGLD
jgi:chromosome segregation ATPase